MWFGARREARLLPIRPAALVPPARRPARSPSRSTPSGTSSWRRVPCRSSQCHWAGVSCCIPRHRPRPRCCSHTSHRGSSAPLRRAPSTKTQQAHISAPGSASSEGPSGQGALVLVTRHLSRGRGGARPLGCRVPCRAMLPGKDPSLKTSHAFSLRSAWMSRLL